MVIVQILAFCTMKKFLESSSSEEEEVGQGVFRAKRKRESSTSEDEDVKHDLFEKVDVDLKNHVYEPVHFVRAHCKVGEKPEVETQVKLLTDLHFSLHLLVLRFGTPMLSAGAKGDLPRVEELSSVYLPPSPTSC